MNTANAIRLTEQNGVLRTPEQSEAQYYHEQLILHRQMVEIGLVSMCRDLKEIRDRKHYVTLGYDDFGAYTETEHGIKQRQAYNYIQIYEKLGIEILHSNAKIGVSKLLQLASLDNAERDELLTGHSPDRLEQMTTGEVRELTEQVRKLEEQLCLLETEKKSKPTPVTVVQQPFEEIRAEIETEMKSEYEERLAELESKTMSDEDLRKYKANAEKEAKALTAEELKKLKAELKAATDLAEREAQAKQAAEEKAKTAEDASKRVSELEARIDELDADKAAAEKKILLSADPELTRFKYLFEAWQGSTAALSGQLAKLDADKQAKMRAAVKAVLEGAAL